MMWLTRPAHRRNTIRSQVKGVSALENGANHIIPSDRGGTVMSASTALCAGGSMLDEP
jgi:hypothetical protein